MKGAINRWTRRLSEIGPVWALSTVRPTLLSRGTAEELGEQQPNKIRASSDQPVTCATANDVVRSISQVLRRGQRSAATPNATSMTAASLPLASCAKRNGTSRVFLTSTGTAVYNRLTIFSLFVCKRLGDVDPSVVIMLW